MASLAILGSVSQNWWMLAIRGVAAIIFGLFAFLWPGLTLAALILLWAVFVMADGAMAVVAGGRNRWWSLVIFGILAIAAGIVAVLWPGLTALALLAVIAAWAIMRGVLEIAAAVRLRRELTNEWVLIVSGALSIVVGVLLVLFPGAGALSLVWLIGAYAMAAGVLLLVLAFRLRGVGRRLQPGVA